MASYIGPNIVRDSLVLALDAGSERSFRGEPTINLYSDGDFTLGITHTIKSLDAASGIITDPTGKFNSNVLRFMPRAFNQYNGKDITVTIGTYILHQCGVMCQQIVMLLI